MDCQCMRRDVLIVNPTSSNQVDPESSESEKRLKKWYSQNPSETVIATSFIIRTPDNMPTTLKRNGSDNSASIMDALLSARQVTIWTDVHGGYSADPRKGQVENELESSREECEVLRARLMCLEQDIKFEKKCSLEKSIDIDKLRNELKLAEHKSNQLEQMLKSKLEMLALDFQHAQEKVNKGHNDEVSNNIERAKLRMRLKWTQAHLDALRRRYREAVQESENMNKQFEEASANLKERLALKGIEVLNLKKQLAAAMGQ
ncbi:kinesin-like protein KIN-7O [Pistacia vera]|uniref:kinesin-like protein KIN-7O n=1 Tax=Pistacia vera TaxID=55513 RepID=UPI001263ACF8|nr:kinesin-like protein KIN-7O [Pistacia vera]